MLKRVLRTFVPVQYRGQALAHSLLRRKTSGNVIAGPFKGMKYVHTSIGSSFHPKLLGTYELELQSLIEDFCREQFEVIIDIGAAEGYYAVGMAMRCPSARVVAAESEEAGRALLSELAQINGVADRITILGECNPEMLRDLLERSTIGRQLIIMDVEGTEISLLDPVQNPWLKKSTILVEVHDGKSSGPIGDALVSRFDATHFITRHWSRQRTIQDSPVRCPFLEEHLVALVDEGRQRGLCWLEMRPRT